MKHSIFVDRIEGSQAVLVTGSTEFTLPKGLLPAGIGEGRWLRLSLEADPDKDAAALDRVRAARSKLGGDDDGGDFAL